MFGLKWSFLAKCSVKPFCKVSNIFRPPLVIGDLWVIPFVPSWRKISWPHRLTMVSILS
jgi:hypothetical protein